MESTEHLAIEDRVALRAAVPRRLRCGARDNHRRSCSTIEPGRYGSSSGEARAFRPQA
jgi:hypothetical protein